MKNDKKEISIPRNGRMVYDISYYDTGKPFLKINDSIMEANKSLYKVKSYIQEHFNNILSNRLFRAVESNKLYSRPRILLTGTTNEIEAFYVARYIYFSIVTNIKGYKEFKTLDCDNEELEIIDIMDSIDFNEYTAKDEVSYFRHQQLLFYDFLHIKSSTLFLMNFLKHNRNKDTETLESFTEGLFKDYPYRRPTQFNEQGTLIIHVANKDGLPEYFREVFEVVNLSYQGNDNDISTFNDFEVIDCKNADSKKKSVRDSALHTKTSITSQRAITEQETKKIKNNFEDVKIEMHVDYNGNYKKSSYTVYVQIKVPSKRKKQSAKRRLELSHTYMPLLHLLVKVAKEGMRFATIKALKKRYKHLDKGIEHIVKAFTKVIGEDSKKIINVDYGRGKRLAIPSKNIKLKEPPIISKQTDQSTTYYSPKANDDDLETMPTFGADDGSNS